MAFVTRLIIAGLVGMHYEIVAVPTSSFMVLPGDSITIPCHYDQAVKDHVKLLCRGWWWTKCKTVLYSGQSEPTSEKYSITDNTSQRMFTVTINNVTTKDKYFWCGVGKKEKKENYVLKIVLVVPNGVNVKQQEITAFEGENVTAMWYIANPKIPKWCRIGVKSCIKKSGWIDDMYVRIENNSHGVYSMEMRGLSIKSSGWYYCINDDFRRYIHLNVLLPPALTTRFDYIPTTTAETMTTISTLDTTVWFTETNAIIHTPCRGSVQVQQETPNTVFQNSKIILIIPPLITLLLTIPAAIFGWMMRARYGTKPDMRDGVTESQKPESKLHYATIVHNQHAPVGTERSHIPIEKVTYTTVALYNNVRSGIESADESPIYSVPRKF